MNITIEELQQFSQTLTSQCYSWFGSKPHMSLECIKEFFIWKGDSVAVSQIQALIDSIPYGN